MRTLVGKNALLPRGFPGTYLLSIDSLNECDGGSVTIFGRLSSSPFGNLSVDVYQIDLGEAVIFAGFVAL